MTRGAHPMFFAVVAAVASSIAGASAWATATAADSAAAVAFVIVDTALNAVGRFVFAAVAMTVLHNLSRCPELYNLA